MLEMYLKGAKVVHHTSICTFNDNVGARARAQ